MLLFFSYDPADSELADQIREKLATLPKLVLVDDPADLLPCEMVTVLISPAVTEGSPVLAQLEQAHGYYKHILPLVLDPQALPNSLLGLHAIDLSQNLEAGIRKLIAEMRNRLGIADTVTTPLRAYKPPPPQD